MVKVMGLVASQCGYLVLSVFVLVSGSLRVVCTYQSLFPWQKLWTQVLHWIFSFLAVRVVLLVCMPLVYTYAESIISVIKGIGLSVFILYAYMSIVHMAILGT